MDDPSPRVRDWATFGVGAVCDRDSPRIRRALAKRLADTDPDTQAEAVYGLVRRQDERGIKAMLAAFRSGECRSLLFRAAYEYPDERWHPELLDLLRRSENDPGINPAWLSALNYALDELAPNPTQTDSGEVSRAPDAVRGGRAR
jgi:hypothetical protein